MEIHLERYIQKSMNKLKSGIYWVRLTNCCSCSYCSALPESEKSNIELAKYYSKSEFWELFGNDVGVGRYTEVTVLQKVLNPYEEPENE